MSNRTVIIEGPITEKVGKQTIEQLRKLNKESTKPIVLYINSAGGYVTVGMAICDVMDLISAPVHTLAMGMTMSAGALIFSNGEKGHRYVAPNAQIMIHEPRGGFRYSPSLVDLNEAVKAGPLERMAKNLGTSVLNLETLMRDDVYYTAEEAIEAGIADNLIMEG